MPSVDSRRADPYAEYRRTESPQPAWSGRMLRPRSKSAPMPGEMSASMSGGMSEQSSASSQLGEAVVDSAMRL
eukprot:scaffold1447_cov115-Isochrysis_galbana.AAC.6